jgi:Ribosomal protein L7/L12 dimerisation domain
MMGIALLDPSYDLVRAERLERPRGYPRPLLRDQRGATVIDVPKLVGELSNLTVLEAAELAKMLKETWSAAGMSRPGVPPFLFKYMSGDTARIVLQNRTLRWSTPGTLNDPYDMQFDLKFDVDPEAVRKLALDRAWDALTGDKPAPVGNALGLLIRLLRGRMPGLAREEFDDHLGDAIDKGLSAMQSSLPQLQKDFRTVMDHSKILCLTGSPDNMKLWNNYAEQHKGVALKFRSVPGVDSPWSTARPIEYLPDLPNLVDNNFLADLASGRVSMDGRAVMNRMVYTKSTEWAYEREWRIYSGVGRDPEAAYEDVPFNPLELDAVILGCEMSEQETTDFSNMVRRLYPHAQVLGASKDQNDSIVKIELL